MTFSPNSRTRRRYLPARLPLLALVVGTALYGCAAVGPDYQPVVAPLESSWQAALPHGGNTVKLGDWWAQFDDPVLTRLLAEAEASSPTLAQSAALIELARAGLVSTSASALPSLDGRASMTRSGGNVPVQTAGTVALDAAWEIDLFGSVRRRTESATAQLEASQAGWHDARVSLAAEVASQYVNLRACEQLLDAYASSAESLNTSARLTDLLVRGGTVAPADGELTRAASATGESTRLAQQAACDLTVKSLVTLTGMPEPDLRNTLSNGVRAQLPVPATLQETTVPAMWVSQRPDLRALERSLAAASADVGVAAADRYPRLSIIGSLSALSVRSSGSTTSSQPWSIGPSLSLPLFDGGAGAAGERSAQAKYAQALAAYEAGLRQAIEEVERALVNLDSATRRDAYAQTAANGFNSVLRSTTAQWRAGAVNATTLELARRDAIAAQIAALTLRRDQVLQWIALYKAMGGGWTAQSPTPPSTSTSTSG